jgi:hypothetical protein
VIGLLGRRAIVAWMVLGLIGSVAGCAGSAAVGDPSHDPTPAASPGNQSPGSQAAPSEAPAASPNCAERYPDPGPAGIDLRLGCIVSALIGATAGADPSTPPRISAWLGPLGAILLAILLLVMVARRVRRSAGRRLASVEPAAWWSCPACRSLNAEGSAACYRCGHPWDPTIPILTPSPEGLADQAIGRRLDR